MFYNSKKERLVHSDLARFFFFFDVDSNLQKKKKKKKKKIILDKGRVYAPVCDSRCCGYLRVRLFLARPEQ
jgi:hypothetical protein